MKGLLEIIIVLILLIPIIFLVAILISRINAFTQRKSEESKRKKFSKKFLKDSFNIYRVLLENKKTSESEKLIKSVEYFLWMESPEFLENSKIEKVYNVTFEKYGDITTNMLAEYYSKCCIKIINEKNEIIKSEITEFYKDKVRTKKSREINDILKKLDKAPILMKNFNYDDLSYNFVKRIKELRKKDIEESSYMLVKRCKEIEINGFQFK